MEIIIALVIGFLLGLSSKGINIKIEQKQTDIPTEPLKSSANNLPPEMVEYAEKNHGMINF